MSSKIEDTKKNASVKWSADNIMVFLEIYNTNYELLWNIRHSDYTNKSKRETAMLKLRDELIGHGIAVPDVGFLRARVKAIKSTYRTELLKVNESRSSGAGTDEVYTPKLPWFAAADVFLRDVIITRKSTSNLVPVSTIEESVDETQNETESMVGTIENMFEEQNTPPAQPPFTPVTGTQTAKKRRQTKLSKVEGAIEKLQKITESRASSSKVEPDENEVFGKYVATQLRELPIVNRLTLQDKIQSMLTKERLKLLQSVRPTPSPMLSGNSSYGGDSDDDDESYKNFTSEGSLLYRNLN